MGEYTDVKLIITTTLSETGLMGNTSNGFGSRIQLTEVEILHISRSTCDKRHCGPTSAARLGRNGAIDYYELFCYDEGYCGFNCKNTDTRVAASVECVDGADARV